MANIVLTKDFTESIEPSLMSRCMATVTKLSNSKDHAGLHIEHIHKARDPRIRSARVNDQFRLLFFILDDKDQEVYVLYGVFNHDEAYAKASNLELSIDPINSVTFIREVAPQPVDDSLQKAQAAAAAALAAAEKAQAPLGEIAAPALSKHFGIPAAEAEALVSLESEDHVEQYIAGYPAHIIEAIQGLMAGLSMEEVLQELQLGEFGAEAEVAADSDKSAASADSVEAVEQAAEEVAPAAEEATATQDADSAAERHDDAELIAGMQHPAAQAEFYFLDDTEEELREIIESGSFEAWRVFLHPSQKKVVDRNFKGAGRVIGGAGTGKTVVAVHRAHRLAQDGSRVLLTTFTRDLADSLAEQLQILDRDYPKAQTVGEPGIAVSGIDSLANFITRKAGQAEYQEASMAVLGRPANRLRPCSAGEENTMWEQAMETVFGPHMHPTEEAEYFKPYFMSEEFSNVVIAGAVTDKSQYLRVPRKGRGVSLNRKQRARVWEVIDAFRLKCIAEEKAPFAVVAAIAAHLVTANGLVDHVVIDEAQDFHAGHWQLLRKIVAPGPNDIFLAEDSHQRIYGQQLVLTRFGIETRGGATQHLRLNYRTTRENLQYAMRVLEGHEWIGGSGEEDNLRGYRSARSGPEPRVECYDNEAEEIQHIAEHIQAWHAENSEATIGVLARTRSTRNRIDAALADLELMPKQAHGVEGLQVMTMHNAKGLEFEKVIIAGMNEDQLPLQYMMANRVAEDRNAATMQERALFYVAASRSRDELVVTTSGKLSELVG